MSNISITHAILALLFAAVLLESLIVVYRLLFHPLASFPGPKHTAATHLVRLYYDLIKDGGGQYPNAYRTWHQKYGPIVRISPDELHIEDSAYYEEMHNSTRPVRKWSHFGFRFQNENSAFGTPDPVAYRRRRTDLNPFFSRRRVVEYTPKLQQLCCKIISRLEKEYNGTANVLNASKLWECFASDGVVGFVFGEDYGFLDTPGFHSRTNEGVFNMVEMCHWLGDVHWLAVLFRALPERIVFWLNPDVESVFSFWKTQALQVTGILEDPSRREKLDDSTLLGYLVNHNPEKHDLAPIRLQQEANSLVGAGGETVSRALTIATFYVLNDPRIKALLMSELESAIPDASNVPSWEALSQLTYLSGCVNEALRLTYGLSERRSRAYDGGPLPYQDFVIPAGTFVSMDNYDVSHDENIFPDSYSFYPERWLGDPKAPDGKHLSRYMVSFGKGMRNCVGLQLAYAEIYIGLANFFRAPFMRNAHLHDTSVRDVEMTRCCFVPRPFKGSQGVRIAFSAGDHGTS